MADNKNIVLVMGPPNSGKTASLRNLPQESMAFLDADLKGTPFRSKFMVNEKIDDAQKVIWFIDEIEKEVTCTGGVLDTITFLMVMYERQYVITSKDTQKAWGAYGNFYRDFIHRIKAGTKDYAILAHESTELNEQAMMMESRVPIKGAVGKIGVEADFTTVLKCMQMKVKDLEKHQNKLLHITPDEQEDGVKYVFCTRVTKEFAGSKMRAPMGLWERNELFIDNDLNQVFTRLKDYFGK